MPDDDARAEQRHKQRDWHHRRMLGRRDNNKIHKATNFRTSLAGKKKPKTTIPQRIMLQWV